MKKFAIAILILCALNNVLASRIVTAIVPFQNLNLNPTDTLQANFSFGNFNQIICFDGFQSTGVGVITWPYRGQLFNSTLSIFLTKNSTFEGQLIDPAGVFSIHNTLPRALSLNCLYTI